MSDGQAPVVSDADAPASTTEDHPSWPDRDAILEFTDPILILDTNHRVKWASRPFSDFAGATGMDVNGTMPALMLPEKEREQLHRETIEVFSVPGSRLSTTVPAVDAEGHERWIQVEYHNLTHDERVSGVVAHVRDVTQRSKALRDVRDSERLFRSLADAFSGGIFQTDLDGNLIYANEQWLAITGLSFEQASGTGWQQLVHPSEWNRLADQLAHYDSAETLEPLELRIIRGREPRFVLLRSAPILEDDGSVIGRVGSITDITDHIVSRRDSQRLTDIFEATHDLVGIADRSGQFLYINASARSFFGLDDHDSLEGRTFTGCLAPESANRVGREVMDALDEDGMWYGELTIVRGDDQVVPVLAQLLVHTDERGHFEFFSGVLRDISERKQFESQLAHQATHDPLTGLPNRVLLIERLRHALDRARRHHRRVAVLFLDLDHFKVVNDSLGHGIGDELLVAIAERLKTVVRPSDTIARFGGDEFVVLCEDLETRDDATAVAERVNNVISGPFTVQDAEVFVGVSIGIAFPSDNDADPGNLIRDADAAMYRAKERGRARWEVFDNAMRASAVDRLDIENALRRAQERRELRVFYQPIISLETGRIEGVEALLRWEHAERGLLLPGDFIHVAEETGLIVPIGAWVLDQACRQVMRWQASMPEVGRLRVSINLSGRQLGHPKLVTDVHDILVETHIDPSQVELEITESVLMDDVEMSEDTLRQLKRLGVKLVVDDFGTGYSSLSYLRRFPVDVLKVDRSFVDGLGSDPSDSAIVTAIVTLAHTLGLSAIAEGVETTDHLAELRRLQCDMAQGFHMARPAPGSDTGEVLAQRQRW